MLVSCASRSMNELSVIGSLCYALRVLRLPCTGQTTQIVTMKCMLKIDWPSKKKMIFLENFSAVLQPFYQKRIKAMLIHGKCKFLFK